PTAKPGAATISENDPTGAFRLLNGRAMSGSWSVVVLNPLPLRPTKNRRPSSPQHWLSENHHPAPNRPPPCRVWPNVLPPNTGSVSGAPRKPADVVPVVTSTGSCVLRVHHIRYS